MRYIIEGFDLVKPRILYIDALKGIYHYNADERRLGRVVKFLQVDDDDDDDNLQLDHIEIPNFKKFRQQITTVILKNYLWIPFVKFIDFLHLNDMFDKNPNSYDHVWHNYTTQIREKGYINEIDNTDELRLSYHMFPLPSHFPPSPRPLSDILKKVSELPFTLQLIFKNNNNFYFCN